MNNQAKLQDDLVDTSISNAAENWHSLLQLQTKMFLPFEIGFMLNCKEWVDAQSVLDVGCGDGSFISQVSNYFPEKAYTGIDISPELISFAIADNTSPNIRFEQADFQQSESDQRYDAVLMRLIVQHLSDFRAVLAQASKLLKPGGSLFIIEPDYKNSWNRPSTPLYDILLENIDAYSTRNQTNRRILSQLNSIASETEFWSVQQDEIVKVPFIRPSSDSDLLNLYNHWIDVVESSGVVSMHLDEVRSELDRWSEGPDTYAQIGINFLHLGFMKPILA